MNQRSDIDNLLVKVTCFTKDGIPIVGFANIIFQLPLIIISYIHNKKKSKTTKLFTTLIIECARENFFSYKRKENIQASDDMIQKGLLKLLTQLLNK